MPVERSTTTSKFKLSFTSFVFILITGLLLASPARTQQSASPKRVLVLYWQTRLVPSNVLFEQKFEAVMRSSPEWTEYYAEFLDTDRFPGDAQLVMFHDYVKQKYAAQPLDVLVVLSDVPLNFLLRYRDELFPKAPIVFVVNKPPDASLLAAGPGMTGLITRNAYKETLDVALQVKPATRQVYVVSGSLLHDKIFENACRQELVGYENRVAINYLTDLSIDELTDSVKNLPEHSIILYGWQQGQDERGKLVDTREILASIVKSANVPIYGLSSWQVGEGVVGGYVREIDTMGASAAEITLQILNGARAQEIPVRPIPIQPEFDWRQLKRWGISESGLPSGSIVKFRVPSLWDEYKWAFIAIVLVLLVQSALITGMFINRSRRKRAEIEQQQAIEALRESEERFRNMADTAPVMIWVSGADKFRTYVNQQWLKFTGRGIEDELDTRWLRNLHPEDLERCLETRNTAFKLHKPFRVEYRLRRKDGEFRWMLDSGTPRFVADGTFLGFIGSCIDITELKAAEEALANLSGQLIRAREDECARIARELHDDVNQRMALVSVTLEQLSLSPPDTTEQLRAQLSDVLGQITDTSREIHRMSYDLHPSKLRHLGLVATLDGLCQELRRRQKMEIEFTRSEVPAKLPKEISLCLYRIAQECLNNVIRHSGAKKARVELIGNGMEIKLLVSDSGVGFDVDAPTLKKGLGLVGMRERLRLVGGSISIDSGPSQGTQIEATIPLMRNEREHAAHLTYNAVTPEGD
jgi:PAS domain S-box-containing protein